VDIMSIKKTEITNGTGTETLVKPSRPNPNEAILVRPDGTTQTIPIYRRSDYTKLAGCGFVTFPKPEV
jgi:hypothetical protein